MDELDLAFRLARPGFELQVDLRVPARGVTALFGRSGCGKTTILRCVAGLERAAGHCRLGDQVWQDDRRGVFLKPHRRPIGYVFQEASLFRHLTVRRNLEYGMRARGGGSAGVGFDEIVDLFDIRRHLGRNPTSLSGGEKQRVAMARALLSEPQLLLMDEPLAALDHTSKQEILPYLDRLHDQLQIPVLFVSHLPDEVARLADRIILLQSGAVVAAGDSTEILSRLDLPLARDSEASSTVDGRVIGHDSEYQISRVEVPGGRMTLALIDRPIGAAVRVRIQARDVSLALDEPGTSSISNILPATILEMVDTEQAQVLVRLGIGPAPQTSLLARITRHSRDRLNLHRNQPVFAQVKAVALMD